MASVRVAVRVRPTSKREKDLSSECVIHMEGNKTSITNLKLPKRISGDFARKRTKTFTFDFSYDSTDCESANYAGQEKIFKDLGSDVLLAAFQGYNACVFAYGQTGSGKSFTMMGSSEDRGLIPRICEGLFGRIAGMTLWDKASFCTKVSYLEIYNERIRDLLQKKSSQTYNLRVREHPRGGPYVEDLSKHLVQNYCDVEELMAIGNAKRTTASTVMNNISSRSHAIFTINFTQARFGVEMPCETVSKIHLVDLAGSERACNSGSSGMRLKEGGSINKSLATLGNVISALADRSHDGVSPSMKKRHVFVPYRDSVLTWILKDSLGGNSKTIMIATISPADINYSETLSTLRYANRARNIINKPMINEDPNVKLIRELRAEIARLKALLGQGNQNALDSPTALSMEEKLHENEAKVLELTREWANKWNETQNILKEETLALRKEGIGVVLDSELPHLIGIDEDLLSTGIILYHLKEGRTCVGRDDAEEEQDIILHGPSLESEHCVFENLNDLVTLVPLGSSQCFVNGISVMEPYQLSQGAVILLGKTNMFRFNHPKEAAKMREKRKSTLLSSPSSSMADVSESSENLSSVMLYNPGRLDCRRRQCGEVEKLEYESPAGRRAVAEMEEKQSCEKVELDNLQLEMETLHNATVEWLCAHKLEESLKRHSLDLKYQLQHLLPKKGYYEEDYRMLEKEQECLQMAHQMAKTFYELEKLEREWDELSRTVKAEGEPLVEEKLDLKEQLCEKYSVVDVLMFYMHTLEEVLKILKACQGQHCNNIWSTKMGFKVGHMEKLKAAEIDMVESQLFIHKETLRNWCQSTPVENKHLSIAGMWPQNKEHQSHQRAVIEEEQQKQQDRVAVPLRWEPCLREAGDWALAKVGLGHLANSSDPTTELKILQQIWLLSAVHHAWGLRTNLKALCGALEQDQERLEHEIYQSKQKRCDCRGCPQGAWDTSGYSSPAIASKSCVAGLSPFADDRLLSYTEGVPRRLQKLDEMNTDSNLKPSECLKNSKELPHGIQYFKVVISSAEISRLDGKMAKGFVEKLSPEKSDCVNHLEKGHLCKEGEMLTTEKVDVSPHKSGRLEMPAESPAEEKGHQACLHGEQDGLENDVSQSEKSSGGSGSSLSESQSSMNAEPLTGNMGEELCGVTLLLLLSAFQADGRAAANRTEVQETSEMSLPGQSLPRSPLAEIVVEGQLSDAGMLKVSTEDLVEPGQEAVSEHKIIHQCGEDDQSQNCGYRLAGKHSWLYQGASSHLHMTEQVTHQIVKHPPFHSWYKQIYMIVKHLLLCQNIHLKVTIKSDTGGAVQLSDTLRNFQNYIKDQSPLQPAQLMAWSHRTSVAVSQDVQFFCQKLVEFPLFLHKLQSLTPQRLLACLGCLIPDTIANSQMLLGVYWLHFANSHQPTPQPGCVLLFQSIIYAIYLDHDLQGDEKGLAVFHQLQLQHIREVHVGFAGQHVRVLGATEHTIFTMYTYSKQLTQELCQALLRVLSPEAEELSRRHPLLQEDLMELSLNWKAHIPDLCLNSRLRLSSQFERALADLVYFLHGNMKEKPSLADVHLLLYTSVRVEVSPQPRPHAISWLLLTDTHVGLVQEDGVFHPVPRSITLMPKQPHFEQVALRKLLDVRCILVADRDSSIRVDIVFKATGVSYQEFRQLGKNNMTAIPSLSEYYLFPYSEVWKLTFGSTKEAAFVINHLSMV